MKERGKNSVPSSLTHIMNGLPVSNWSPSLPRRVSGQCFLDKTQKTLSTEVYIETKEGSHALANSPQLRISSQRLVSKIFSLQANNKEIINPSF